MKKFVYVLTAAAVALGFASCQKNSEVNSTSEGKQATVSVNVTQGSLRAIGNTSASALTAEEGKVKKLEVFVFNGDARDGYKKEEGTDVKKVTDIAVTTGSRTIIVVANAFEDLSGITSKAALKAIVSADLVNQTLTNGLLMTCEETDAFVVKPGKNQYGFKAAEADTGANQIKADAPIALTRVAARISLVEAKTAFEGAYANYVFEPAEVYVYNVKKQSKYFGTDLNHGSDLLSGTDLNPYSGEYKPGTVPTEVAYLKDVVTDLSTITTDKPVYYYVFENDATIKPTIFTIKGKIKKADDSYATKTDFPGAIDNDGFTYYSIVVNGNKGGYTYTGDATAKDSKIKRNTKYNLSVKIKHLGKDDPTVPPTESATLDVMIEVAPWLSVDQAIEY
ncbi:MAG: fimbrial protein [Bacteroidales bacterium]|uniref:fimbrial protein n=1 Tax=Porphyromonas sp. TaxID=1924944 RepID=UPI00297B7294|nr:fimbrial protein [Porphyromonas sp.]MDD7438711.1 fimbrial protein [Bacteroidales bacterium]MDY3066969.1 fimbrial protein [Porphyromonas sp.]